MSVDDELKRGSDYVFKGPKSRVPRLEEMHPCLFILHMQEVGEIGWQVSMLLTTVESYLSSPFGSTQKC